MALTPASLRLDLKCGNGAISEGEKCTKGPATRVTAKQTNSSESAKSKPKPSLTRSTLRAAKGFAEFVGPDMAADLLLTGGSVLLGRGLLGRRRQSYRYRQASRTARRTINRVRFGPPSRRYGPRRDSLIQHYAPVQLQPPTRRDACWKGYEQVGMKPKGKRMVPNCVPVKKKAQADTEDGKKYSKTVTNPKTGRKNKVSYGAKGYTIAPGTDKGDRYCARSFGDMKSHGKDCSGADRNTPLCLSRAKWKCSGKTSRRDGLTPGKSSAW